MSIQVWIDINVLFLLTVCFHLWFLCDSDLRISCLYEEMEKPAENTDGIFHIFEQYKVLGVPLLIGHQHLRHGGSLEITLTVP